MYAWRMLKSPWTSGGYVPSGTVLTTWTRLPPSAGWTSAGSIASPVVTRPAHREVCGHVRDGGPAHARGCVVPAELAAAAMRRAVVPVTGQLR